MTRLFTNTDSWTGSTVDALMFFGAATVEQAIDVARAIWSYPRLDGPYRFRDVEPQNQPLADFSRFSDNGCEQLLGVFTHSDGSRSPFVHTTILDDNGLWVYAGPTIGGLTSIWNVGAYPIEDGTPANWLGPLLQDLRVLTEHVYQRCPILGAMYGWLTTIDLNILLEAVAGRIPDERWNGLAIWRESECDYFPPTHFEAPIRHDG
jgi:hypothetical protein